jgi:hypothetical protein
VISRRSEATRLGASYAAGLTTAHILAAGAVSLMIVSLTRNSGDSPSILSSRRNLIALWTGRCLVTFETSPYSSSIWWAQQRLLPPVHLRKSRRY